MKWLAAVIAIVLTSSALRAQTCEGIATQFFKTVQEDKYKEAMDQMWATNPYSAGMKDTITQLTSQLTSAMTTVGKYRGNHLVVKKEWAGQYAYLYYFVAFDRQPLKFEFHCYKPTDKWVLQNFKFSDQLAKDFEESAARDVFRDPE